MTATLLEPCERPLQRVVDLGCDPFGFVENQQDTSVRVEALYPGRFRRWQTDCRPFLTESLDKDAGREHLYRQRLLRPPCPLPYLAKEYRAHLARELRSDDHDP